MPQEADIPYYNITEFATNNTTQFSNDAFKNIDFATRLMPIALFKEMMTSQRVNSLKDFNTTLDDVLGLKSDWDAELEVKVEEVNKLKEHLDQQVIAFNFVGLFKGFNNLSRSKWWEIFWARLLLCFLGLMVISPLCYEIYKSVTIEPEKISIALYLSVIPILSITIILVYFFRISLHSLNSSKSQLDQIELRKTLCMFIQDYAKYSVSIKKEDPDVLAKFESLIFSNILPHGADIPSAYDGIEQLSKLISSVKNGK
ncbi:hypothetical protein [Rouxiella silvae]|nr:hypothetical protein [Rouxiella silvae]